MFKSMENLIQDLARRHVTVTVIMKPRGEPTRGEEISNFIPRVRIEATVETTKGTARWRSWPAFEFTVIGESLHEVATEIEARIVLAEQIIKANELSYNHEMAVYKARDAGIALSQHVNKPDHTSAQLRVPDTFGGSH